MSGTGSRISTDIDFTRDGKHQSYLRVPVSTNRSVCGTVSRRGSPSFQTCLS